jgi:hypothetical protein
MKTQRKSIKDEIDQIERDEIDKERSYIRGVPPTDPGQVYSIRIPVSQIETVRRLAVARGMKPSAMLRNWIIERLNDEAAMPQGVLRVAGQAAFLTGKQLVAPIYVSFEREAFSVELRDEPAGTLGQRVKRISEQRAAIG